MVYAITTHPLKGRVNKIRAYGHGQTLTLNYIKEMDEKNNHFRAAMVVAAEQYGPSVRIVGGKNPRQEAWHWLPLEE